MTARDGEMVVWVVGERSDVGSIVGDSMASVGVGASVTVGVIVPFWF